MTNSDFADFNITEDGDGKHAVSKNSAMIVSVLADGKNDIRHRRTIKPFSNPVQKTSFLVCRLDDVNVFIKGHHIIITKQEIK